MKTLSALIALLAALFSLTTAPLPAQAVPIEYDFVITGTTGPLPPFFSLELVVDSAALGTGLHFVSECSEDPDIPCVRSGNWQDFISLTAGAAASIDRGLLTMDLTFNVNNGTISGAIDSRGVFETMQLAGDEFLWSTTAPFLSDAILDCSGVAEPPCGFTGFFFTTNPLANATVPEPASMIAIGTALALFGGFATYKRRRNA